MDNENQGPHNEFYYAIRSGSTSRLNELFNKYSGNSSDNNLRTLDETLSKAYEELKLKNVQLSQDVEIFVQHKLINLRFFSNTSKNDNKGCLHNIKKRIELILQNIDLLKTGYSNLKKVDELFLFVVKFIAQNIHILKRQLKSTYDITPWEEMEFCLICFVSTHINRKEINLFYRATLDKEKILKHLTYFQSALVDVKDILDITKMNDLPKLSREKIEQNIIKKYPAFEELYKDHHQIRNIHSLQKIHDYVNLSISANPERKEEQLIIIRSLQVMSEYFKNTLESPNLSTVIVDLLLLTLPNYTRKVMIELRNSQSHAYSLYERSEIEKNAEIGFFTGIQNDVKKINEVITDILHTIKLKVVKMFLKKIINTESVDEIVEVVDMFSNFELDIKGNEKIMSERRKIEKLIKQLSDNVTNKTRYEQFLFNEINEKINCKKIESDNIEYQYISVIPSLTNLKFLKDIGINHNTIRLTKQYVNKILKNMEQEKIEPCSLKEITELTLKIFLSACPRLEDVDEIYRLTSQIILTAQLRTDDLKWNEKLKEKLNEKNMLLYLNEKGENLDVADCKYDKQLEFKLSELKNTMKINSISEKLNENFITYKMNKKLLAIVEMQVLDILSILGHSKNNLENNLLFLDENTPLLTGKCLRNYLAHDNAILDILLTDPSLAVVLNAEKLISENIIKSKKKIGKLKKDDPSKLKEKFERCLKILKNQGKLFATLEKEKLRDIKKILQKGADIYATTVDGWTALHFAARGTRAEVAQYVLQKVSVNVKDLNGSSPIHIAASYGRKNIVEFLVKNTGVHIDNCNKNNKTPLHFAAQNGHREIVKILLKNQADVNRKDKTGSTPLHYALRNNDVEIIKVLLEDQWNIDVNEAMGGFTPLHLVSESGHMEMINLLIKKGANVNAMNSEEGTPLHIVVMNDHLDVVNALVLNGADVNSSTTKGWTPLHCAVVHKRLQIVEFLLARGADVNAIHNTYTPLHYAAQGGHFYTFKKLLENKPTIPSATEKNVTPLHLAARNGYLRMVSDLLVHGIRIFVKDCRNATSLHYACQAGHKQVVMFLLVKGANINEQTVEGCTPLYLAAIQGHKVIVEFLMKKNADVTIKSITGYTPLHAAAMNGNKDVIDLLIKNKADINAKALDGSTPLHLAVKEGHKDAVYSLIENNARINSVAGIYCITPLHTAIVRGHKDIANFLIANNANVKTRSLGNMTSLHLSAEVGDVDIVKKLIETGAEVNTTSESGVSPLYTAVVNNHKEIVEILIQNGADVIAKSILSTAVLKSSKETIDVLLKNKVDVKMEDYVKNTPLHYAASRGDKEILKTLIEHGANVHASEATGYRPLHVAAQRGHDDAAEILIANGANVNIASHEGMTPLHDAASFGHVNVIKLLLSNGAKLNLKDERNRTPLEFAVGCSHLQAVKILLQYDQEGINSLMNGEYTLLHIAVQQDYLPMVKLLVDEGSDINIRNGYDSKPIHLAARDGYVRTIEFFLSEGMSIDEHGKNNQTLIHCAASNNQLDAVRYLILRGADINAKCDQGLTALRIAATFGYKEIVEILLKNGAVYNVADNNIQITPSHITDHKDIIDLLESVDKLFIDVKNNRIEDVKKCIMSGAIVNAKNADGETLLHCAAWKGYDEIVEILLQNEANPDTKGIKEFTALHYAAKFSHLKVVKLLLYYGAMYNPLSDRGKTPLDLTEDKDLFNLLNLIQQSFKKVNKNNETVIDDINNITDIDTFKAVMGARNSNNQPLVVVALKNNFSQIDQLKQVWLNLNEVSIEPATEQFNEGNHQQEILYKFRSAFAKRKELLGPDNPGTLDIQFSVTSILYKLGSFEEALKLHDDVLKRQTKVLGPDHRDTLSTKSSFALVLFRLLREEEAINIFREVYHRQREVLQPDHLDITSTQFRWAKVLDAMGNHEEALIINRAIFEKRKELLGANDPTTVRAQNTIAVVLSNQGKFEEAFTVYKEVYEKKKMTLGIYHYETIRSQHSMAVMIFQQNKYNEALKAFEDVLVLQEKILTKYHPETLLTRYNIARVLFTQAKWMLAFKAYTDYIGFGKTVLGSRHQSVLNSFKNLEKIRLKFKMNGNNTLEKWYNLQRGINKAACNGDLQTVTELLKDGAEVNNKVTEGRTPLDFAINNGHGDVVKLLLENGADATDVTSTGNTPLHKAIFCGRTEIVKILLEHMNGGQMINYIDAKTTGSGSAALHLACNDGSIEIVKCLLKHGAIYKTENNEGKTPIHFSKNQEVTDLLKLVEELFEYAKDGNVEVLNKLGSAKYDDFLALTNARNNQRNTILQVAITNQHKNIASELIQMMKTMSRKN